MRSDGCAANEQASENGRTTQQHGSARTAWGAEKGSWKSSGIHKKGMHAADQHATVIADPAGHSSRRSSKALQSTFIASADDAVSAAGSGGGRDSSDTT